jgi:hypothetical protein
MGYIKVAKAGIAYDIVSCEGVGDVKIVNNTDDDIVINYLSQCSVTIDAGTGNDFTQDDVQLVIEQIQEYAGASGPAPLVQLSLPVASVTMAVLAQATT